MTESSDGTIRAVDGRDTQTDILTPASMASPDRTLVIDVPVQPDHGRSRSMASLALLVVRRLLPGLGVMILAAFILFQYNIWPGVLPNSAAFFTAIGTANCFSANFPQNSANCIYNAYPAGLTVAFGYPEVWLVGAMHAVSGLSILNAFRLIWGVFLIGSLVGARFLFGHFTQYRWLSWGAAGLYLISPIVADQAGYGPLQIGFALLPSYLLLDVAFLRAVDRRHKIAFALGLAVVAMRTFALFTDGYSLTMSLVPSGLLYLIWGVRRLRARHRLLVTVCALVAAVISVIVAYFLYVNFLGVSAFAATSVDFFRGQGVDLYPMAVPPTSLWFADFLGLHHNISATEAFSDGHNLSDVYISWSLLLVGIFGAAIALRHKLLRTRLIKALVLAGLIGFLLSLGPSMKIADFRPTQTLTRGVPAASQYLMSAGQASFSTGLAWIYQHVPAINTMRALYRWDLLLRLALVALAVVALGTLTKRRRRTLAIILMLLIAAENMPVLTRGHQSGVVALANVDHFNHDVVDELGPLVHPGERALLVNPFLTGTGTNDYLANWICPELRLRCVNTGGDKSDVLAAKTQSAAMRAALASSKNLPSLIVQLFATNQIDVIIFVHFDMRASAYSWPPSEELRRQSATAGQTIIQRDRLVSSTLVWSTVVRPR